MENSKATEVTTLIGRVRMNNPSRGFGFARAGDDYFFHMTQFIDEDQFYDALPGRKIQFTPTVSMKDGVERKQATKITLLKKEV